MTVSSATNAAPTVSPTAATGTAALSSLTNNFNDFLTLLTTQLKNQDPTAPMDANQFTSQLVQFTGVAQQINTNTTLGQILTANLAQQLGQASGFVGHQVTFTGGTLPLQNGAAQLNFQTSAAEQVQIAVSNAKGTPVFTQTVNAVAGANTWTWNGATANGMQLPDGAYTVAVTNAGASVPFQAVGTVTGAEQVNQAIQLEFGAAAVTFNNVVALN